MNRRGFLAFLAATPLAGALGLKLKPKPTELPTATGTMAKLELEAYQKRLIRDWTKTDGSINYENMTDLMKMLGEEAGKSHARVKAELASRAFKDSFWK